MHKTLYNISRGQVPLAHACGRPWLRGAQALLRGNRRPMAVHSTLASNADNFISHRPILQYVTLDPT